MNPERQQANHSSELTRRGLKIALALFMVLAVLATALLAGGRAAEAQEEPVAQEAEEGPASGLPGIVEEPAPAVVGEEDLNSGNIDEVDVLPGGWAGGEQIDGVTGFSPLTLVSPPYTGFPYRRTVYLVASWRNHADTYCTGSLIDSRWVLTTRTCIYQEAWGGGATEIVVYPGYNQGHKPYGSSKNMGSIHYWSGTEVENNLGFFPVDRPVGGLTGWYRLCPDDDSFLLSATLPGVGYPSGSGYQFGSMYSWSGTFDYVWAGALFHNRVGPNMLGSPAYRSGIYDCIVGVLNTTTDSGSYYARLTQTKINHINAIIGETRENPPTAESFFVMNVVPSQTIVNAGEKIDSVQFDFYNDSNSPLVADTQLIATIILVPYWGAGNCAISPSAGFKVFYAEVLPRGRITLTVDDINVPRDLDPGEYNLGVCVKVENHDEKVTNLRFLDDQPIIDIRSAVSKPLMLPVVVRP